MKDNFNRRFNTASKEALTASHTHPVNGDEGLTDKCGTYSKCVKQDSPGKVNIPAFNQFRAATMSGLFSDFEAVTLGGSRTLNGPMGAYASMFCGADSSQFGAPEVPAPYKVASKEYAAELIELYWCSLLRDVAFSDFATNSVVAMAVAELDGLGPVYKGPRDSANHVTPELLFRGTLPGEEFGPYISQFFLTPTTFGAAPFDQKYTTYRAGVDYVTDEASWYAVQNGVPTGLMDQKDMTPQFLHNGRGLAAFTHVDELYQSYFTAYLVLESIGAPTNPTSPYVIGGLPSKKQNPFGTFGGADIAAVLAQVAKAALNAVWYQKWVVHLRHRPESGAGLVHFWNKGVTFDAKPDASVFHSKALQQSHMKYGSDLLSQPFPEGSPAHPAYPTGHGAVGGACITILKFFYDGTFVMSDPMTPSADGSTLTPWTGDPTIGKPGLLTVQGELHKLAHNVTFGHGLHGGIHWRSDSDSSVALGEAVAIRFLNDLACSYAEPLKVTFKSLTGALVTISNM